VPAALRLATRGSALALAQARLVARMLERAEPGLAVELVEVRTSGDERRAGEGAPAPGPGEDKSRFVKEIEEALLAGDADLAVHSAKDVPGALPGGLAIVGVPERADARDALCGAAGGSLADLPEGAVVGTSSLRRRAQLLAGRPDLDVRELRGNVDTRLRKLASGGFDAVVLATAGLERLGRGGEGAPIDPDAMTPAPGQGCLALEARDGDERAIELAGRLTDPDSLVRLTAERALVGALEATCRTPVAAHAVLGAGRLRLAAFAGLPDGSAWVRDALEADAAEPAAIGEEVARRLLAAGAGELLAEAEAAGD
jgi:hydroxymethylbilane synthase